MRRHPGADQGATELSTQTYQQFLESKTQRGMDGGFEPVFMPEFLFDFQRYLVEWEIRKGCSATFSDCGTGKTPMELVLAENIVRKTDRPVLILTPLAVSYQTEREAEKFGMEARVSRDGAVRPGINITNYEKLHLFSHRDVAGCICDESGILKSFDGATRSDITVFMRKIQYRGLFSATPAPNDFYELGTSSEALGYLGYMDMLNRFFKNNHNNSATSRMHRQNVSWRLKGHAELPFWRWVCSWARAMRKPSDLGFDDARFTLPPLETEEHLVHASRAAAGMLFDLPAIGLKEQREERRRTSPERCEYMASLFNQSTEPGIVWCHLNDEGDTLERLIPDAIQISGKDSDDRKEAKFLDFVNGNARVLVTKPKIGAWGLNFQHCAHVGYFPDHSYEQFYQCIRRCWRYGQKRPVKLDIVTTQGQQEILANQQRKSDQADRMFSRMVECMNDSLHINRTNDFTDTEVRPSWLSTINA
jgi:hypothetical protein